jgi:hypothetical protein
MECSPYLGGGNWTTTEGDLFMVFEQIRRVHQAMVVARHDQITDNPACVAGMAE